MIPWIHRQGHDFTSRCLGWQFQFCKLQVDPKQNPGGLVGGGVYLQWFILGCAWHKTTTFWHKNTSLASVLPLEVQDKRKNGQTFGIPYQAVWSLVDFLLGLNKKNISTKPTFDCIPKDKWSSNNQISGDDIISYQPVTVWWWISNDFKSVILVQGVALLIRMPFHEKAFVGLSCVTMETLMYDWMTSWTNMLILSAFMSKPTMNNKNTCTTEEKHTAPPTERQSITKEHSKPHLTASGGWRQHVFKQPLLSLFLSMWTIFV